MPEGILTFLIADIRGYTSFTQQEGDEAAARLASKFADIAREGIEAHGGELIELRGDEALAVFTSPRAAIRASADLQTVFADEQVIDPSLPLRVGIGLDAGEAVAVNGGYRGGALNLAARLCSQAGPGEVLVSQEVAHLARAVDGLQLEPHGEVQAKGLSEPVRVFRVSSRETPVAHADGGGEVPQGLRAVTPMIGRDGELRRLRWCWRHARRGQGRIVAILGPPGIGKTRLAAELAATVADSRATVRYCACAEGAARPADAVGDEPGAVAVVLDDLDTLDSTQLAVLLERLRRLPERALVVLAFDGDSASAELLSAAHQLAGGDESIIRPQPLGLDDMLRVAALYVGAAVDVLPHDLLSTTAGNPRRLHETISSWAQREASRRLGILATQAAADRGGLRSVEAELAGTVIDLQRVHERARLYGVGPGRHAEEPETPPYPGLTSFGVEDAERFFGRERLVAELISRLAGAPLLGVVGPSGSGKSSLVRAGLVPALGAGVLPGSERWSVLLLRPGEHPLRALDRALWSGLPRSLLDRMDSQGHPLAALRDALDADERVVIVVDQFEEAFTICTDRQERAEFLEALAAAATPDTRVISVLALRADFYGSCAAHPGLANHLAGAQVLVGPMTADEYRRAIVQPALRAGVDVEPALVDDLVHDVLGEPGALPLLSTTLRELWTMRDGRVLRREAYLASGGVRRAVAQLAEDVYASFDRTEQSVARSILLRLAGPGEGEGVVRRRVSLMEFDAVENPAVTRVLGVLADRRIVTVSDGSVEVAHEALLREWPRLLDWLDEDREGRRLHAHLAEAARDWADRGRDPADLYRGPRLVTATDWTAQHALELNDLEREFITRSGAQSRSDLQRQRRQNRRLRTLLAGVAALLIAAVALGAFAFVQNGNAQNEARIALARQLGAEAVSASRIDQAMLLARQAVLLDDTSDTEGTLLATLLRSPAVVGTFALPTGVRPLQLALSADGRTLAAAANDGSIHFFDTTTYHQAHTPLADHGGFSGGAGAVYAGALFVASFTPPGDTPPAFDVYDARTLRQRARLRLDPVFLNTPTGRFTPLLVSADGRNVFFAFAQSNQDGSDGPAYLDSWDVATGTLSQTPLRSKGMDGGTVLDGGRLMLVTDTSALTIDAATLQVVASQPIALGSRPATVSPDGRTLAVVSSTSRGPGDTFSLLDIASGRSTPAAAAQTAPIDQVAFTPDGREVVTTSDDHSVVVWSVATAAPVETLRGHASRVVGLALSRDGRTLYTSSLDGVVFAWDLGQSRRLGQSFLASTTGVPLPGQVGVPPLAVSPDGAAFATATAPAQVGILSTTTGQRVSGFAIPGGLQALAWSRRDVLAASPVSPGAHGGDAGVQVWAMHGSPQLLRTLSGVPGAAQALAFSSDGGLLVAATLVQPPPQAQRPPDGWVALWDVASGRLLMKHHVPGGATAAAIDRAGLTVVAGDANDGHVIVIDARTGRVQRTLTVQEGSPSAVFTTIFAADGTLLTGSWDGIVQRWNTLTGLQVSPPTLTEEAPVSGLALSPDGTRFATTGGSSGDLKVWDLHARQQIGSTLPGTAGMWGNAAYTPDGAKLVVVYLDTTGELWPVSVSAWMDHACAVAHRNLSEEEWSRFVPSHPYTRTCPQYPSG